MGRQIGYKQGLLEGVNKVKLITWTRTANPTKEHAQLTNLRNLHIFAFCLSLLPEVAWSSSFVLIYP